MKKSQNLQNSVKKNTKKKKSIAKANADHHGKSKKPSACYFVPFWKTHSLLLKFKILTKV